MPTDPDPVLVQLCLDAAQEMVDRFAVEKGPLWPETVEMFRVDPIAAGKYLQRCMNAGDLMVNGATCLTCKTVTVSETRHDFNSCECGLVSVDGGTWYGRRVFNGPYEDCLVAWPWVDREEGIAP